MDCVYAIFVYVFFLIYCSLATKIKADDKYQLMTSDDDGSFVYCPAIHLGQDSI